MPKHLFNLFSRMLWSMVSNAALKSKDTRSVVYQCIVIQPYFCCNIHNGRDALNYFGSRLLTGFSQQLAILNPMWSDFKYPSDFGISEKVPDSVGFGYGFGFGIRRIPTLYAQCPAITRPVTHWTVVHTSSSPAWRILCEWQRWPTSHRLPWDSPPPSFHRWTDLYNDTTRIAYGAMRTVFFHFESNWIVIVGLKSHQ